MENRPQCWPPIGYYFPHKERCKTIYLDSKYWNPPVSELTYGIHGLHANDVSDNTKIVCTRLKDDDKQPEMPMFPPIVHASTYAIKTLQHYEEVVTKGGYLYSRLSNPTCQSAECAINALEGGAGSLVFSSGMAAITTALLTFLKAGDHVVSCNPFYSGSFSFFVNYLSKFNIETTFVSYGIDDYKKAIRPNTKVLYAETPANPLINLIDLEAFGKLGQSLENIVTIVDSTFASPYLQKPLQYGVDIVVHSATKYLGGHSDLSAGVITTKTLDEWKRINMARIEFGGVLSPHDANLLLRGTKTIHVRMDRICDNAEKIAEFLVQHPKVEEVRYPGLPSHPGHEIAKKQMKRYGGMISFVMKDGLQAARFVVEHLRLVHLALSLGAIESLIAHPASMTHGPMLLSDEDRAKAHIGDGLLRLSVGIEDVQDLINDLKQALDKA